MNIPLRLNFNLQCFYTTYYVDYTAASTVISDTFIGNWSALMRVKPLEDFLMMLMTFMVTQKVPMLMMKV